MVFSSPYSIEQPRSQLTVPCVTTLHDILHGTEISLSNYFLPRELDTIRLLVSRISIVSTCRQTQEPSAGEHILLKECSLMDSDRLLNSTQPTITTDL